MCKIQEKQYKNTIKNMIMTALNQNKVNIDLLNN